MEHLTRDCPVCLKSILHSSKKTLANCSKMNRPCKSCSKKKYQEQKYKRKCSGCSNDIEYLNRKTYNQSVSGGEAMCSKCVGKRRGKLNDSIYKKMALSKTGKKRDQKTIEKMRISMRNHRARILIENGYVGPRVNPEGCRYMDMWGKENGYSFIHGLNGREKYFSDVGVFVDGYDQEKNVVFEFDEKHHFDSLGNLKKKDIIRMNDIMRIAKCTVIRYNSITNKIQEYSL